jgi:hypothetical protein
VPVVNVSLSADVPGNGLQEILVTNETGSSSGCNAVYGVCDSLAISNWTLTVNYTSSYYGGAGPSLPSPFVAQWQSSADDILPTAPFAVDFDLCGSVPVASCSSPTTTISSIDFSGTLSQSSFTVFDPSANGGAGGPGPTFFADPAISFSLTPSAGFPGTYYESVDGSVSDQGVSGAPEPDSALLLLFGLGAVLAAGRYRGFLFGPSGPIRISRF